MMLIKTTHPKLTNWVYRFILHAAQRLPAPGVNEVLVLLPLLPMVWQVATAMEMKRYAPNLLSAQSGQILRHLLLREH